MNKRIRNPQVIVAASLLGLLQFVPFFKSYESSVTLQIEGNKEAIAGFHKPSEAIAILVNREVGFGSVELNRITVDESLEKVIDRLNLTSHLGVDRVTAINQLKKRLCVKQGSAENIAIIKSRFSDPALARDVANAVVQQYIAYNKSSEEAYAKKVLADFEQGIQKQEDRLKQKGTILDQMMSGIKVPIYANSNPPPRYTISDQENAKQEKIQLIDQLTELEKLEDGQLIEYASSLNLHTQDLHERCVELKIRIRRLKNTGLTPEHPDLINAQRSLIDAEMERQDSITALRDSLKLHLARTNKLLAEAKSLDSGGKVGTFFRAKRDYEEEAQLLKAMRARYSTTRITLRMPRKIIKIQAPAQTGKLVRTSIFTKLVEKIRNSE